MLVLPASEKAGSSTPLKYASLRMTGLFDSSLQFMEQAGRGDFFLPGLWRADAAAVGFLPGLSHQRQKKLCFFAAPTPRRIAAVAVAQPAQGVHRVFKGTEQVHAKAVMLAEVKQRCAHAPENYLGIAFGEFESGQLAAGFS